ncbi:hypothetical protein phytr_8020 [Candidatus Phycorickettsia trachydisci]|uniref:Uncharacterized protein n=1 Tax=Candidatus Phycorickettsia trachydisci TaxID=2115978 RepID=A0A2P1P8Z7_9RICK|nr:hypothetical protein [Candidatus Phycorickettsia trachydisci]AVP87736.1 hypothetical protein phytr_8020 [Candidatus Phycorickettsia trachydisci]
MSNFLKQSRKISKPQEAAMVKSAINKLLKRVICDLQTPHYYVKIYNNQNLDFCKP